MIILAESESGECHRGVIKRGQMVAQIKRDGTIKHVRIAKLFGFSGLKRIEIEEAKAGDLVAVQDLKKLT